MLRHLALCLAVVGVSAGARAVATPEPGSTCAPAVKVPPLKHLPDVLDASRKSHRAAAPLDAPATTTYNVTFLNLHTLELLPVGATGALDGERLSHFLRCRVTGSTREMAARPAEVARDMALRFETDRVEVISGFRSEKFNELLRKKGRGVAARSRHMVGQALDFRVPGVEAQRLASAVAETYRGGVGTYRESDFVHVDVGPDRRWRGR